MPEELQTQAQGYLCSTNLMEHRSWLNKLERWTLHQTEKGLKFHVKKLGLESVEDGDEESEPQKKAGG